MDVSAINLRVLAAVSAFASKDEARYYLNGVCVEFEERSATYVATDGHRLIAYRDELPPDAKPNQLLGTFIIPTAHCKHFKLGKEESGEGSIFGSVRLTIAYNMVDVTFVPIDGVFPDWRKTLPAAAASGVGAQYNLASLATFRKFSDTLGIGQPFLAPNGEAPAFLWFSSHPHIVGVLMPMRMVDEINREAPRWARRGPERDQGDIEDVLTTEEEQAQGKPSRKKAKPPKGQVEHVDTSERPFAPGDDDMKVPADPPADPRDPGPIPDDLRRTA